MKRIVSLVALALFTFTACSSPRPEGAPEFVKNYLIAPYESADAVESKLKAVGFDIVARLKPVKRKDIETFILTNAHLKDLANKPMRALVASVIRVTINKDLNTIQVTNPLLYLKAYLQNDYKVGDETPVITALMKAFPNLSETNMGADKVDLNVEQLAYDNLAGYHFMVSMPYYQDMDVVGEAKDMKTLIKKLKKGAKKIKSSGKKKFNLTYLVELSPERYVAGLRLSKRTEKFVKKIGYKNAGLLPWGVMLEMEEIDGKKVAVAKALNAKYRIALNYSDLDMGGFMGIMTVPGAITTELSKVFK